jgi:Mannosyltransferase (PIG-V)
MDESSKPSSEQQPDALERRSRRWLAPGSWSGLGDTLALFLTLRVLLGLVALYVWWAGMTPGPCHFELARNGWATIPPLADSGPAFPLVGVWQRWDACWYSKIATFGYEPFENSIAFWPLFPLLTGIVSRLLGGAVALAGLVVAGVSFIAAIEGIQRLVGRDFSPEIANRTIIAISFFPTAFFFFAPFTESLFLALSVWTIIGARERRWLLTLVVAFLASLTRIQGLFLMLPIAWEAGMAWRASGRRLGRLVGPIDAGVLLSVAAALAPLAAFGVFFMFGIFVVGKSPLDTQDAWGGRNFHPPWEVVAASWSWAMDRHDPLQVLNLATLIGFGVAVVAGIRRLPAAYSLIAIPQVALLATRIQPTPLSSTVRYLMVVFPVFVLLAEIEDRRLQLAWLAGSIMFLTILLLAFETGQFVA